MLYIDSHSTRDAVDMKIKSWGYKEVGSGIVFG
jgi:hypothetical protein